MVDTRDAFNTQSLRAYLESGEDFTPPDFEDYLINMADASIITINHSDVGHKHKSRDRRCNSFPRAKRRVPTVLGQYLGSTRAVLEDTQTFYTMEKLTPRSTQRRTTT